MLENLVWDCVKPCIMDLKMGTQQFSENDNEAKRMLKERKCAETTSASLGFRICGTQGYQIQTSAYIFHDKYYGRSLNELSTKEELRHFFHNGVFLRCDVIEQMIQKIVSLECVLIKEKLFNLHSTSLLLLYDGDVADDVISVASNHVMKKNGVTVVMRKGDDTITPRSLLSNGLFTQQLCSQDSSKCDVRIEGLKLKSFSDVKTCTRDIENCDVPNEKLTLNSSSDVKSSPSNTPKHESYQGHRDISHSRLVGRENCALPYVEFPPVEKGNNSIIQCQNENVENAPVKNPYTSRRSVERIESSSEIDAIVTKVFNGDAVTYANQQRVLTSNVEQQCRVDMRLIDFANASDKTSDVENAENRPILFGLGKLKAMLNEILQEEIHHQ
ncbi:uncharacterized protein LOC127854880 [Dreissena polymorpha]|uniref:Kinase n=1 Tax=Dreissena polymorpha TaxID=45954 RepID=A0A9D4C6J5_DREPO|nr:uncharacterized protein LOC127854880 [Dreissena polymorpha]XP_052245947.1 uncharacterized protein LOC127854880 [Dreissena polymorpha]KAH3718391.1 hypothetical protein DPMN_061195 [Dreissena polymorpha]